LAFHPHIHSLLLAGAVLPDGSSVQLDIDSDRLQKRFADKVLAALVTRELISEDTAASIKSWPHSGFNVFIGNPIPASDLAQLLFTARYLKKCPVSNQRLTLCEHDRQTTVTYCAFRNGTKETRHFTPLEFLAELQQHIPDMWEQTTRYYGCYSARSRGAAREHGSPISQLNIPEPTKKPSQTWATLMKKVFEIDPLTCPKCGSAMSIKAFITDSAQIERIAKNLGIITWRAPPTVQYQLPQAA
jgi:hypothetical protein